MNLYQLNADVSPTIIGNVNYDIRSYTDFIKKAIELLDNTALELKLRKEIVQLTEDELDKNGKVVKKGETETRYYADDNVKDKKVQKAVKLVFNENTKEVFEERRFNGNGISIIDQNEEENYLILAREIQGNHIYLKPDTYQLRKQKESLDNLRHSPLVEHTPLLRLFGRPYDEPWSNPIVMKPISDWHILNKNFDGEAEQKQFVQKAISTPDFALMEGPPGSGKTTTIIELVMQFLAQGKRVLLCSATHAAVDNVIERVMGKYRNVCEKEIVPVRISRYEKPVKEGVRSYLLKNLVATYKKDIVKHLKQNGKSESQQYLLQNIEKHGDSIDRIILDSANLVGGTMIGILQHPDIKSKKLGVSFDVLIVDEASKVTFSDFIVPALHAKRWILVGDVKQLSPYVEDDYVSENLSQLVDKEEQNTIVRQYETKRILLDNSHKRELKIYFTNHVDLDYADFETMCFKLPEKEADFFKQKSLSELTIEQVTDSFDPTLSNIVLINSADLLICADTPKVRQLIANNIFVKSLIINGSLEKDLTFLFRQNYFHKSKKGHVYNYTFQNKDENWAEMVASRLNQLFSFRNAGEKFANIDQELSLLVPNSVSEEVNELKRLVFPSILELLQNGVGKPDKQHSDRILSDGFSDIAKEYRFSSLSYQHRMHPDIAKTSKENFYDNKNLESPKHVSNRDWCFQKDGLVSYATNEPAVKWVHNNDQTYRQKGRNENPTEVTDIEQELKSFCEWAKQNPRIIDGKQEDYEVAVLPFYLEQERALRTMIRKFTGQKFFSQFSKSHVKIYLYTVDKFQGQEADLVLLAFTKFSANAFYNSPNRLNVALTRARFKLILFGNREALKNAKLPALRDLANNFSSNLKF